MIKNNGEPVPSISKRKLLNRLSKKQFIVRRKNTSSSDWFLCKEKNDMIFHPLFYISDDLMAYLFSQGILENKDIFAPLTPSGRVLIRRLLLNDGEFLGQHQTRAEEQILEMGQKKQVLINHSESPLTWLAKRKTKNGKPLIEPYQLASGERLRAAFEKSHMAPQITQNWGRLASSHSKHNKTGLPDLNLSEAALTAKQHFFAALDAVGPELSGILVDVCCEHRGLEDAEKKHGWPKRSGKIILSMALTRLARHYGFIATPRCFSKGSGGVQHWGEADYRPALDGSL